MTNQNPAPSIDLTIDGKTREVFMSYTLLNQLVKIVGDFSKIGNIIVDHDIRDQFLTVMIQERDERGRVSEENFISLDNAGLSVEDANVALKFGTEHVADFFVEQLRSQMETGQKHSELMEQIATGLGLSGLGSTT